MKNAILPIAIALAASSSAFAVEDTWYAKASYGTVDLDTSQVEKDLCTIDLCYDFDNATGFSLNLGYRLNRYIAFEAGYTDLGNSTDSDDISLFELTGDPIFIGEEVMLKTKLSGSTKTMAALFSTDASRSLSAGAKLGYHFWESEVKVTGSFDGFSFSESEDDDGTDIFYGVFANWRIGNWNLGLEHTLFQGEEDDPSMTALSLGVDF